MRSGEKKEILYKNIELWLEIAEALSFIFI